MNTRKCGGIGVAAWALAIGGVVAFAQQTQERKTAHPQHDEMTQACAKACSDCQRACDSCATHCAYMLHEGKKEHLTTVMSCQDCATICATAAQIVSRGGPQSVLICDCCAKACDQCGTACEKFPNDEHMKTCAEECRKCENACRAMVKHRHARRL